MDTLVIVNPASRGGRTGRDWASVESRVLSVLGPCARIARTERRGHAIVLGAEAARAGVARVVVAGGDGTASEVVTGMLASGAPPPTLGLLPLGTGSDFVRALGSRVGLDRALAAIDSGSRRRVDVGRVLGREGGEPRCFLNVASLGLSGSAIAAVERFPSRGAFAYAAAAVSSIARWRGVRVRISVDGRVVHDGPLALAAIANGRYFGGGMLVAPEAEPDDELFDVVIVATSSRARLLTSFPRIYRGAHVGLPGVRVERGRIVEVTASDRVELEADGELLAPLPARVELLASAIDLLVEP